MRPDFPWILGMESLVGLIAIGVPRLQAGERARRDDLKKRDPEQSKLSDCSNY